MPQVTQTFSDAEMNLLQRSEFFMLKLSILDKVTDLFVALQEKLSEDIKQYPFITHQLNTSSGKIFRGENYRKLPYVVCDYPKLFTADSIFTFRSMFWWSHEYSFTLHLAGHALEHYKEKLMIAYPALAETDGGQVTDTFYFCTNTKQWDYHFEKDNYAPLNEVTDIQNKLIKREFVKIARRLPLTDYNNVLTFGSETFHQLMKVLL
jgi:hypothetical protein